MNIRKDYPEYTAIEAHIRRAHAERSVYLAHALVGMITATGRGLRRLAAGVGSGISATADRRAIEADAFLKRSVPKY